MRFTPKSYSRLLSMYLPYLGAGVKVDYMSPDWMNCRVSMKLGWHNRNAVGTHFGGSLYSMADPHFMLMLLHILGREYVVWDKAATIDFVKPGKGRVYADFVITPEQLTRIREETAQGQKYLPEFAVEIKDEHNEVVAKVDKVLYVRRKSSSVV